MKKKEYFCFFMLVKGMAHQEEEDAQVEELVSQLGNHAVKTIGP